MASGLGRGVESRHLQFRECPCRQGQRSGGVHLVSYLNADLYDALKSANADDTLARRAAETATSLDGLKARVDSLTWMVGLNMALTTMSIGLGVSILLRLP
jgi:hypothetical protein